MSAPKHWDELEKLKKKAPNQESDLRSSMMSPSGLVTLWVLVEGDADPYFYERMFDLSHTKVLKVGKKGTAVTSVCSTTAGWQNTNTVSIAALSMTYAGGMTSYRYCRRCLLTSLTTLRDG